MKKPARKPAPAPAPRSAQRDAAKTSAPPAAAHEPTLGELMGLPPDPAAIAAIGEAANPRAAIEQAANPRAAVPLLEPSTGLPGFQMGDEPPPLPPGFTRMPVAGEGAEQFLLNDPPSLSASAPYADAQRDAIPAQSEPQFFPPGVDPGQIRYESRITILEAFQYLGRLDHAPDYIDRSWLAWGDYDPLRGIEAGPALRVPLPYGTFALCRVGDYVCRQAMRFADRPDDVRVEVWARADFEKNFLPSVPSDARSQQAARAGKQGRAA